MGRRRRERGPDRAHFADHRLELSAANVLQVDAIGPAGGRFVEVHRHAQLAPDFARHALRQAHAFLQRDAFDGDERDDIGGADTRVGALMRGEIDEFDGFGDAAQCRVRHRGGRAYKGEDAAIVVGVRFAVEQDNFRNAEDRLDDGVHLGAVAPFGEIGNALNELSRHELIHYRISIVAQTSVCRVETLLDPSRREESQRCRLKPAPRRAIRSERLPLISRNRGELPAPTNEPSRLVGGPTVAMLDPNCGFEMSFTGWSKLAWLNRL
jgi:hypothetical protein